MSKKHPVIAITGSSGAGTTTVKRAFEHIFYRDGIKAAVVEGDSYHRYDRVEMRSKMTDEHLSHFGPQANRFDKLSELFETYGKTGGGEKRYYLHSEEEAEEIWTRFWMRSPLPCLIMATRHPVAVIAYFGSSILNGVLNAETV